MENNKYISKGKKNLKHKYIIRFNYIFLFFLISIGSAAAVTVEFTVLDEEANHILEDSGVTISAQGYPPWIRSGLTNEDGVVTFMWVPNNRWFTYVVSKSGYISYVNSSFWVSGDTYETVYLERLLGDEWEDVAINDDNIRIVWSSDDNDNVYYGGETLNSKTTITNVNPSEHIVFDSSTGQHRNTYYANGSSTIWNSAHTPDPNMRLELKPDTGAGGGWFWVRGYGTNFEFCTGKSIISMEDTVVELEGSSYICIKEERLDTIIPNNWNGTYYTELIGQYKLNGNIHEIIGQTGSFTIYPNPDASNKPPKFNTITHGFGGEEDVISIRVRAPDPDLDNVTYSINDSRFVFTEGSNNDAEFTWQTGEGDAGIFNVTITASDGEFEVNEEVTITVRKRFEISLQEGFNLISFPVISVLPDYHSLPHFNDSFIPLTQPIENNLDTVFYYKDENWYSYSPDKPLFLNSLHTFDESMGVWFKMDSADTLTIAGLFKYPVQFNMSNGWNMIGYPSAEAAEPQEVFGDVYGTYKTIFAYNASNNEWQSYNPDKPEFLNSLHLMIPGHGYWVYATQDSIWEFNGTGFSTG